MEEQRLCSKYSILDQSPAWNLSSGIFQNYFRKLFENQKMNSIQIFKIINLNKMIDQIRVQYIKVKIQPQSIKVRLT